MQMLMYRKMTRTGLKVSLPRRCHGTYARVDFLSDAADSTTWQL